LQIDLLFPSAAAAAAPRRREIYWKFNDDDDGGSRGGDPTALSAFFSRMNDYRGVAW